jgi:hypothetical protein
MFFIDTQKNPLIKELCNYKDASDASLGVKYDPTISTMALIS